MSSFDDHCTILSASENLDKALGFLTTEIQGASLYPDDMVGIVIRLAAIEAVADTLRERANIIAETRP